MDKCWVVTGVQIFVEFQNQYSMLYLINWFPYWEHFNNPTWTSEHFNQKRWEGSLAQFMDNLKKGKQKERKTKEMNKQIIIVEIS